MPSETLRDNFRQYGIIVCLMIGLFTFAVYTYDASLIYAARDYGPPITKVLHHEQTIAVVSFSGVDGSIGKCELILAENHDHFDKIALLTRLSRSFPLEKVTFPTMLAVVDSCKDMGGRTNQSHPPEVDEDSEERHEISSLLKGILPGTLWCGFDDIAPNYSTLGRLWKLDRCCRAHDHCPVKVKGFNKRYGVFNMHPYAINHCDCDDKFYDCLKNSGEEQADSVGQFFFNVVKMQCIQEKNKKCLQWDNEPRPEEDANKPVINSPRDGYFPHIRLPEEKLSILQDKYKVPIRLGPGKAANLRANRKCLVYEEVQEQEDNFEEIARRRSF